MKPPAFQFYADDFLAGTFAMTNEEVGAYIRLLCHQWSQGGIPADEHRQFLMARTNNEPSSEAAVRYVVRTKFVACDDGLLRNERMEDVRTNNENWREKSAIGGRASGSKRKGDSNWGKKMAEQRAKIRTNNEPLSEPLSEPTTNSPSPSPSPINTNPLTPLQGEYPSAENPKSPAQTPKGALQLRAERLMRRRPETPLTENESRAFRRSKAAIEATTEAQWQALERYYAAPQAETYSRKDLAALVNNWNGEIDRALAWSGKASAAPARRVKTAEDFAA
jgi:uncharacterized protein YdaU (DUF1376 family)